MKKLADYKLLMMLHEMLASHPSGKSQLKKITPFIHTQSQKKNKGE